MRIVLDLQGAQGEGRYRGVGRYTLSLAQAIIRHRGAHEVILALNDLLPDTIEPIRALFDSLVSQDDIRVWQAPGPTRADESANEWRRIAARRIREAFLESLQPDVIHVSDMFGGFGSNVVCSAGTASSSSLTVMTLYDLIPLLNQDAYLETDPRFKRHYLEMAAHARLVDGWLAISESSACEGRDILGLVADSVINVSAACDVKFRKQSPSSGDKERLHVRYGLTRPYVMYSGGSDRRKNLVRLIDAYGQLPTDVRDAHHLVLVGTMVPEDVESLTATARRAGLGSDDLRFTGYVEDDDLVLLYNLCELFVLPSIHEGFGLPALEAMSCGAAVIGANLTSLPEVIGWSDALFDPLDVSSIRTTIARALTEPAFRSELICRGAEQAQRFSWDESARRTILAFERFHERRVAESTRRTDGVDDLIQRLVRDLRLVPGGPTDRDLIDTARAIARNHPRSGDRRLLVDVSELIRVDARSGIQRVVRSMLRWLPGCLPNWQIEPVYATTDRPGYRHARCLDPGGSGSPVVATDTVVDLRPNDMFLGLDLQLGVVVSQSEFFAEFRRLGNHVHFVVYDLLPILIPHRFTPGLEDRYREWLEVVCAADGALCISRSVADELRSWLQTHGPLRHRPFQISWFHLGADVENANFTRGLPGDEMQTLRELSVRPTFLLVGTIEPRKGHAQTLAAFERLWGEHADLNLAFVGRQGWHMKQFVARLRRHAESGRRLFWMDDVSDEFLDEIYRASSCLVAPSEAEGFGLPLIEAARQGTPIIARDIPVFREVAGQHAFYFSGLDPQSLAEAVREWLALRNSGQHPRSDGMAWLTWEQSAAQAADVLLGKRPYVEAWSASEPAR